MPNRKKHMEIGFIIAVILFLGYLFFRHRKAGKLESDDYLTALLGSVTCILTSVIPDILEPPYSPHHRAFFHSKTFSILISGLTASESTKKNDNHEMIFLMTAALSGFLCHILLDSATPKGLPLV